MAFFLKKRFARNLKNPQNTIIGSYVKKKLIEWNSHLEENAVKLCRLEPHQNVLEVGFGPGIGIKKALEYLKDGTGKMYGIETSKHMIEECKERFKNEIFDDKLVLLETSVHNIPCNDNFFDRVFHVDSFHYWPNLDGGMHELYRVMKPHSYMVVPIDLERVKKLSAQKLLRNCNSPDFYTLKYSLERQGFVDIKTDKFWDAKKQESFYVLFARTNKIEENPLVIS
ncbi:methyltransferase GfsG-like [Tubulanus polymorphus]|uniref:methyltransferase GfsG-like n=1 Tax=Tubulanus polymorphus TaxID=672921 RepID=UPI003DA5DD7C